jgi:hypothetical protein
MNLDIDGDGILTTTEQRANQLNDELEREVVRTAVGDKYTGKHQDRYSPGMTKQLAKMRFSRKYWVHDLSILFVSFD